MQEASVYISLGLRRYVADAFITVRRYTMNIIESIKNLTLFERVLWLLSVTGIAGAFILVGDGDKMTLVASLVGVTALIFVAKGDVLGQILTVAFSVLYAIISYNFRYFGEMITYVGMTAPIAVMSVVTWLRNPYSDREVKVNHLKSRTWGILLPVTGVVTWVFYYILRAFDTPNLGFSTLSIATSFLASSLTMLRSPYYAVAYAANDIVLIVLWVLATMEDIKYFPMILCFSIFFVNDIYGFVNWRKMSHKQQKESIAMVD